MKTYPAFAKRCTLVALVALPVAMLYSQAVAPRPSEGSPPASAETVQLSPFVVNSSKDTGYQATSTLAGTRLNTPLKDLGASISVYTRDLLDDIGATNSNDLLRYVTGMDASGPGGNFSGSGADINTIVPVPEASREDPQGTSRSRGLSAPSFTRDFFNSTIDIDTYNTERVTVLRGPNAALIGVSSPAGVTDTSLIRADVQRNMHKVVGRYGNNDSWRTAVDFNRVIIPGKLAARLAGLEAREEFNQRPAYERKERIFGAVTYQPHKSTVIRGNFESGQMRANRPDTILPGNNISREWYNAGRPGFDWTFYDDPARNPNAAAQNAGNFLPFYMGQLALAGPDQIIFNSPDDQSPSYIYQGRIGLTNANAVNSLKDQLFHPTMNRDMAQDNPRFRHTLNIWEQPAGAFWVGGNVMPGQLPGLIPPGLKQQGFSDFSVFDFENRMLDETGLFTDDFHAFNVALEQRAWDNRIGIELAYDEQRLDRASRLTFNRLRTRAPDPDNQIRVDVNLVHPTGLPNPNYGRPFVMARGNRWITRNNKDRTVRATGYLKYDFKDIRESWSKWLGSHTLSGVLEQFRRDTIFSAPEQRSDGTAPRTLNTDPFARNPTRIVYVGPSLIGNNNALRLNPIRIPQVISGPLGSIAAFERPGDLVTPGGFVDSPYSLAVLNSSGQLAREVIKSRAATLQSYWLQDHVVTMLGWRRDTDYFAKRDTTFVFNPATPNDFGKVVWGFEDFNFPRTPPKNVSKDAKSYSVVVRWPQKLVRLPAGSDFSVFYNNSENFTPVGGRVDFFNRPLAVPEGETEEYGFNFSLFGDKLGLRVNRFETSNTGVSYNSPAIFGTIQAPQTM